MRYLRAMTFAGEEKLHFLINNDYYSQLIISAERRSRAAAIHVFIKGSRHALTSSFFAAPAWFFIVRFAPRRILI
ncbi:hypothetical protein DTU32_00390 [Salmonella enterica subsp. enterica serovar Sendai]|nr:hypothetical protein CO195_06665 [Salmonella enterica subsp. enterica]EBX8729610.1 hypothetical protein [Salmonella enterica subsp. enterica serovar Sendai]ECE7319102.1 hypothetical protein [Salmonella enterica subsp. enterica serovar Paratyphi A]HAC6684082.1 hypothetical protein [Salmonella enterica subsp. enterica serovar Sendai]